MSKGDLVELSGKIIQAMGGGFYKIVLDESTTEVRARLSGRLKKYHIRVLPGDDVTVSVSPYDMSHGLITYRGKPRGHS